ncbi:MAG: outer membrane lipoprotein-sorting protein [Gammaproteobacteria bacterium]|nr:outer membrane lipoprotein-sorting protein [Gammaproteobacteria bacterium]
MRLSRQLLGTIFCLLTVFIPSHINAAIEPPSAESVERAREILRSIDDLWRGDSSYAIFSMHVKTEHYQRSMQMEAWSKGKDKSLVKILKPLKEKGTASLKSGKHLYSYLPRTDRTIRLTSGMMMGSWMGSHFTNDDLVDESRMDEDYTPAVTFEGVRDGNDIIEFALIPKEDAAVVWGKIILTVFAKSLLPIEEIFYDEDGIETRRMSFSDYKVMSGRELPAVMRVTPTDKPDEYTEIIYETLELNVDLKDSLFSINSLKRRR